MKASSANSVRKLARRSSKRLQRSSLGEVGANSVVPRRLAQNNPSRKMSSRPAAAMKALVRDILFGKSCQKGLYSGAEESRQLVVGRTDSKIPIGARVEPILLLQIGKWGST